MKCWLRSFTILILHTSVALAKPLTLDDVYESVDRNHPAVLSSKQDIEKYESETFSAQGGFDPVLKAKIQDSSLGYYAHTYYDVMIEQPTPAWGTKVIGGYKKGLGNFPVNDIQNQTFDQGEFRAGVEIPILKGGLMDERRTRILSSETGIQIAQENLKSKRLETKREAGRKYWDWVASGKKYIVAQDLLKIALLRDQALLTRIKKGDAAQIDHTDNQRTVVQRKAGILTAQRNLQKASIELSLYYRDERGNPILVPDELLPNDFPSPKNQMEPIQPDQNLDQTALRHPDTKSIGLQIHQNGFEKTLAQNQILPKLDMGLLYVKDFGINPGTSYLPPSNYTSEFRVAVTLEIPLFLRSARGKANSISATQQKLTLMQDLTRDRIRAQILDSSQSLRIAAERIEYTQQEVELSQKLEDAERARFQHGDSSLFIVNLREQATRDAMNKNIDALCDFFKAKNDYDALVSK